MYCVYILKSQNSKRFYIGFTSNLGNRLKYHNSGRVKSTKAFRPWEVIYSEDFETRIDAIRKEYYLKSPKGYKEKRDIIDRINGEFA